MSHISQIERIRERARRHITAGAVTDGHKLDRNQTIAILNEALAAEIVCMLRYSFHYFVATGSHSDTVKSELKEHAAEEQTQVERIAERIQELGGKPDMNPTVLSEDNHSENREGSSPAEMIHENLIAERLVVETYREIARFFADRDPTSRALMEDILSREEEYAGNTADLLGTVDPSFRKVSHPPYFADEGGNATGNGMAADPSRHANRT
jgi:bacterioferritin